MSSTIKKVIKVSYEQYHDLLTKGKTIDKDGNEHLYDDTASYNVYGYDELMALNNKIDRILNPQDLEEIAVYDLQSYVTSIIEKDTTLQDKSYFAFTCELKKNDKIIYDSSKNGKIFVNGKELTSTHINVKNKNEIFRMVVFANDNVLDLSEEPDYILLGDVLLNQKNQSISLNLKYQKGINKLVCYGTSSSLSTNGRYNILEHYTNGTYDLPNIPSNLDEVISDVEEIPGGNSYFVGLNANKIVCTNLKKINCDNKSTQNGFAESKAKIISFPKLQRIEGRTSTVGSSGSFLNVNADITIPESCMYIGNYLFNSTNARITMNCKYANIENLWIYATNTQQKIILCEDWQTSINVSKLSVSTTPASWYQDVIKTKLADRTGQDALIFTVPTAIFTTLNAELCDVEGHTDKTWVEYATQVKNWTIQGG